MQFDPAGRRVAGSPQRMQHQAPMQERSRIAVDRREKPRLDLAGNGRLGEGLNPGHDQRASR